MFYNSLADVRVEDLRHGSLASVPVRVDDWDSAQMYDDEWQYFEAEDSDDRTDHEANPIVVIVRNGSVNAIYIPASGTFYESGEWERYEEDFTVYIGDSDDTAMVDGALTEDEFNTLFDEAPADLSGPVMNSWYPCASINSDDDARDAARVLRHSPLCVVEVNGNYGLALAGGGQDFTWEIVEAFMLVGQLPPVHYAADLPGMADRGRSDTDKTVIAACLAALSAQIESIDYARTRLVEQAEAWATR